MGGGKRGEENLTKDTPPKKGVLDPPSSGTISTRSGVIPLVFLHKNSRLSRPEAGGVQKALLASPDVIISSQICGSKLRGCFRMRRRMLAAHLFRGWRLARPKSGKIVTKDTTYRDIHYLVYSCLYLMVSVQFACFDSCDRICGFDAAKLSRV